jgi:deazaflavin-dependent oxidoreductase (nitroreductase family)
VKKNDLKDRLSRYRQIKISVIGRKSGKTISIPVWFVLDGEKLYLLPVRGSDTQWYKNVLQNPSIRIDARGVEEKLRADPVTDAKAVKSVIEKFREKYGAKDVKKYYSKFDVAAVVELAGTSKANSVRGEFFNRKHSPKPRPSVPFFFATRVAALPIPTMKSL